MATSDNSAEAMPNHATGQSRFQPTRYDLVLAIIPSVFIVAVLIGHVLSLPPRLSVFGASLLGALAVADALFVNPPRTGDGP